MREIAATGCARSQLFSRFYYAIFSNKFGREQQAFLAGRNAYHRTLTTPVGSVGMLRRNVHRLEKGLLMRPRRVPFALDYIAETVNVFTSAIRSPGGQCDDAELAWATDVLTEYFRVHADEAAVDQYRVLFRECNASPSCSIAPRIPYLRDITAVSPVAFESLASLAKRRRSVRWFLQKQVERELIDQALEVGAQAPSACNRQPFAFRIFDDPALVQEVIGIPFGLAGYGHNVPMVAVVIGQQRNYFDERDRHLIYIDASLVVMGFILALETLGLCACCVNWPDIEEKERRMSALLELDTDERPVMLIAIGYPDPDGMVANSTKKSLQQLRRYNFE